LILNVYDEDLVDDGPDLQRALLTHSMFYLRYLSRMDSNGYNLANILVDPNTFKVTGIVD